MSEESQSISDYPDYPEYPGSFIDELESAESFGLKVKVPFENLIAPPTGDEVKHALMTGATGVGKTTLMFRALEGMIDLGWTVVNLPDMKVELLLEAMVKRPDIKVVVHRPSYISEVRYPSESELQTIIDWSSSRNLVASKDSLSTKLAYIEREHGPDVGTLIDNLEPHAFNILLEPCAIIKEFSRDRKTWAAEANLTIPNIIRSMMDIKRPLRPLCIAIDEAEFFLPGARNTKFENQNMMVNETISWLNKSRGYRIGFWLSAQSQSSAVLAPGIISAMRYMALFKLKKRGDLGSYGRPGWEGMMKWMSPDVLWRNISSATFVKAGMFTLMDSDVGRFDSRRIIANPDRIPFLQKLEPQFEGNPEKIITPMPLAPRSVFPYEFVYESHGWVGKEFEIKAMRDQVGLKEILFLQTEKDLSMRRIAEVLSLPNQMRVKRSLERAQLLGLQLSGSDKEDLEQRFKDVIMPPRTGGSMEEG